MRKRASFLLFFLAFSLNTAYTAESQQIKLSLKEAMLLSQKSALNVLVADARVQQAMAQIGQARAPLMPQVSGSVNGLRQSRDMRASGISLPMMPNYTGPFNTFDARGRITQTIFDASAYERLKAARFSRQLSLSQQHKAKEDAMALTAVLYIDAKRARQQVSVMRTFVRRDAKAYLVAKTAFAQGTITRIELAKARADYLHSRYQLKSAMSTALERRLDLGAALRLPVEAMVLFDEQEDTELLVKENIEFPANAPDVRVARDQVAVAQAQLSQTKADNYPKISLTGDYGRSGETPQKGSNTYTFGVMATIPIWQGGQQQANSAQVAAKLEEAKAVANDASLQSSTALEAAKDNIEKAKVLIKAQAAMADYSHRAYMDTKEQFNSGLIQEVQLAAAKAQQAFDEDQYKEALAVLWTSRIALAKAQGRMQEMVR